MKKRLFGILLSIAVMVTIMVFGAVSANAETHGYLTYTVYRNKASITKCSSDASGVLVIPNTLGGYPVSTIEERAFYNCSKLTNVIVPDSVNYIRKGAFEGCSGLESITLPFIGGGERNNFHFGFIFGAEYYSDNSKYVPKSLKEIVLSDGAKTLPYLSLFNCNNITSIFLPTTITKIEDRTLAPCLNLKHIYYAGSWNDWTKIDISEENTVLPRATIHYYCSAPKNGWVQENGTLFFYENNVKMKNVWRLDGVGWRYLGGDGKCVVDSIVNDSTGRRAYITPDGYYRELNDWVQCKGVWYYLENGYIASCTLKKDSKGWLYLGEYGTIVTNEWVWYNNYRYYAGEDGYVLTSDWVQDSCGWLYLDETGKMLTNKWVPDSIGLCYVGSDGYCLTDQWIHDGIDWRFVDKEGRMVTNKWLKDSMGWCYVGEDGYWVTNEWAQDSMGWCWLGGDGRMVYNDWLLYEDNWYYLDGAGYRVENDWRLDSKGWCYLGEDGAMLTSTWIKDSVGWCYIDENGYCLANGTYEVDGHEYTFDADGRVQGEPIQE